MKNIKNSIIISLACLICIILVSCDSYSEAHTKSEKAHSTNIELEQRFDSIQSIKGQTDKLAKNISDNITLSEVIISAPNGDFDSSTTYFIYYGEVKENATKYTLEIDNATNKIVKSKIQKGYPEEIGGTIEIGNLNTSIKIKDIISTLTERDDYKKALESVENAYTIGIDFCSNKINITVNENSKIIYETTISEKSI